MTNGITVGLIKGAAVLEIPDMKFPAMRMLCMAFGCHQVARQ